MTCLLAGTLALTLAVPAFTLGWTHSVEHVDWQEDWRVEGGTLALVTARVRGSGAGMEPGAGAVLRNGWWEWEGDLTVPALVLAMSGTMSGATGGGWTLCADGGCRELAPPDRPGAPLVLRPCDGTEG